MSEPLKPHNGDAAVRKAVSLFLALAREGHKKPLTTLAQERGIGPSTAYRLIQPFVAAGLLSKPKRQCFMPGLELFDIAAYGSRAALLEISARGILTSAAKDMGETLHFGIWHDDMVTYLVKARGGEDGIFTQEGMQLEAYCSAIGKVLLAYMPLEAQDAYLANGPFIALTDNTVIDPDHMRREWAEVSKMGYSEEVEEVSEGLRCIAVPVHGPRTSVIGAISLSTTDLKCNVSDQLSALKQTATVLEKKLGAADAEL